jgi:hypothetical protein
MSKLTFDVLPPKYEKQKKRSILHMDDDELEEYGKHKMYKRNYEKQFNENKIYFPEQNKAAIQEMNPEDWENLDNPQGPSIKYVHPLYLQEGTELEANLNSLTNRGVEIPDSQKKTKQGIWGGKMRKSSRKSRKGSRKNSRKGSRKSSRKGRKSRKSRK